MHISDIMSYKYEYITMNTECSKDGDKSYIEQEVISSSIVFLLLVRKEMDVNEHDKLENYTLQFLNNVIIIKTKGLHPQA